MIALSLATRDDDAGIRRLLASTPMPGRIRVRFEREPDYFAGCAPNTEVLVARDGTRVVGIACRVIRKLYVNGVAEDVGYLGQLRLHPAYRGQLLTARGYRVMRKLHADGRARGYYTTIVDGNAQAEGVLVRRPRGVMPRYRYLEKLYTLAVSVQDGGPASRRPFRRPPAGGVPGDPAGEGAGGPAAEPAARQNLFPAYDPEGEIVSVDGASAALSDQRAYKQTVIDGYDRALSVVRPLYNLVGKIRLPKPNTALNHAYVTHFQARDEHVARNLIEALQKRAAGLGVDHILLGFTESDPFLRIARDFHPVEYTSSIYTVAFDDGDDFHDRLLARPRSLDISAL